MPSQGVPSDRGYALMCRWATTLSSGMPTTHSLRHPEISCTMSRYRRHCAIEKGCVVRTCDVSAGRPKGESGRSLPQQVCSNHIIRVHYRPEQSEAGRTLPALSTTFEEDVVHSHCTYLLISQILSILPLGRDRKERNFETRL